MADPERTIETLRNVEYIFDKLYELGVQWKRWIGYDDCEPRKTAKAEKGGDNHDKHDFHE